MKSKIEMLIQDQEPNLHIAEMKCKALADGYFEGAKTGYVQALNDAIAEIVKTRNHWQKRFEPDKNSEEQGLKNDSLVYFEFTKMVLEMLIQRLEEAKPKFFDNNLGE